MFNSTSRKCRQVTWGVSSQKEHSWTSSWDNGAVVREVRGIFTISVASEIKFSQLLIKLIVPLLLYSQRNLVPMSVQFSSVQFSRSVMSDSWWPHESQHARPPCPSPSPGVHSDSHPSSPWCYPAISSSVIPFSSCPQSLPASESFPMSQLFAWGGQSTGVSALASFLPKKSKGGNTKGLLSSFLPMGAS